MNSLLKSALLSVLLPLSCLAQSTESEKPAYVVVGGGLSGVLDNQKSIIGMVEFQPALHVGPFGTWLAFQSSDQDYYLATGLLLDWYVTERLFITPSFGAGVYAEHNGTDLGHPIEFRSGVECGYDFQNAGRISLGFWHISNGQLRDKNPGIELVALRYALPLGGN